ncbi:hypothetical protein L195_g052159 [Trifolium pratense]|uniref:Uncharacterized protein n=1 Tax=Trifolium pratense TaxID=57577 RepID=A0A2K3K3N8_TRIPR|nr:hypothetical protein L195_g052159 [Trifolium pratense]
MATEDAQPEQPLSLASPTRDSIHNDAIHINKLFFKGSDPNEPVVKWVSLKC